MTFWQSMVISFLANSTNMAGGKSDKDSDPDIWGKQAQNFLICLAMLLFSIAHFYCFPTDEWQDGYRPAIEKKMSAGDNLALGDFMNDLKLIIRCSDIDIDKKKKKKMRCGFLLPLLLCEYIRVLIRRNHQCSRSHPQILLRLLLSLRCQHSE